MLNIHSHIRSGNEHASSDIQLHNVATYSSCNNRLSLCPPLLFRRQQTHLRPADRLQPDSVVLHSSAQLSVVRFFRSLSLPPSLPALCPLSMIMIYTFARSSLLNSGLLAQRKVRQQKQHIRCIIHVMRSSDLDAI